MNYVELHTRSAFSFLRGASLPEYLIAAAMDRKLPAMALLDRDGVYGAPRFYSIAHENNFAVQPRVGAEITMEDGTVVPLLATSQLGYQNLCQLITEAKLVDRKSDVARRVSGGIPPAHPKGHKNSAHAPDPTDRKRP